MARKTLTIAATLLATAASGVAVTAGYASWTAHTAVARLIAENSALSVGSTDVDAFGGRVILHDVAMTTGSLRVYARTLSLPMQTPRFAIVTSALAADRPIQLAQWPTGDKPKAPDAPASSPFGSGIQLKIPGQAAAPAAAPAPALPQTPATGSASASDVTIIHGTTTYTIKKIDVSGTALTNAALTTLLDPKNPDPIATRLQKLNAGSIVISEIVSDDKAVGNEVHAGVTQILLANVAGGKIGAASAAGSTISGLGEGGRVVVKTGAIQASGLDLALLERMIDTVRTDDAEPLKALSDSLTISDLTLTNPAKSTSLTVATLAQKALKARPLKTDLATLKETTDKDAPGDDTVKAERSKALLDDISSSFEVGAFSIDKIAASNTEKEGVSTLGVARIALDDYRARKLAAFTMRDFLFQGPSVKLGFATLDLSDIAIPPVTKAAADTSQALSTDTMPSIAKADMSLIDVDTATPQDDGTTSKVKFKLAHVGSSSDQRFGKLPSQGALAVDSLTFDLPDSDSPGAQELLAMGYRHLDVSGAIATTYDQKAETLSVQKLVVSGVDMGAVTVALDLGNVAKGILSANHSVAKASALAMLVKRIDLRIANSGLFDKALDWKAKQDGKSVADERASAIDLVSNAVPEMLGNGPGIKAVGAAVAAFIAEPKTLHISAASKDGLGAADMGLLGTPDALLERLDIQAEANK
ncbi:hypothetical protein [Beijerinckia sp. L45]|uniref:hypothetical protein n=1 Tax=Beijerinckia sp. L45 TaxID=1641855 RepID=UPI00131AF2EA|nr:hypothetical protein [Beijerinckia sp. L45]